MNRHLLAIPTVALTIATLVAGVAFMRAAQIAPINAAPTQAQTEIRITDYGFIPAVISITAGAEVDWVNYGEVTHTVSITGGPASGPIPPTGSFSHVFTSLGTYPFWEPDNPSVLHGTVFVVQPTRVPVNLDISMANLSPLEPGAQAGTRVDYNNNDSNFDAFGVVVTVTLPAGTVAFTSTANDGSLLTPTVQIGPQLVYQVGMLPAYTGKTIWLSVLLPSSLDPVVPVTMTARIAAVNPDPQPDDNYYMTYQQIPAPNLTLSMYDSIDTGPFIPGGMVTYSLTYANQVFDMAADAAVVTQALAPGSTFLGAYRDTDSGLTVITPTVHGEMLTITLGVLAPNEYGHLYVRARLNAALFADAVVTSTAGIHTPARELRYDDNLAVTAESVSADSPDLWVQLEADTANEINGREQVSLNFGNGGPQNAHRVQLSLRIPQQFRNVTFDPPPASYAGGMATWTMNQITAWTTAQEIVVNAVVSATGQVTFTASITTSDREANPYDNTAVVGVRLFGLSAPTILGPLFGAVPPRPAFWGRATPGAQVSVYLSATSQVAGKLIGTGAVDIYGEWALTATHPIPAGTYWFTVTQALGGRVSEPVGTIGIIVVNSVVNHNWLILDGERWNNPLGTQFVRDREYRLGFEATACANPLSPAVQIRWYDPVGYTLIGHASYPADVNVNGHVEVSFRMPMDRVPVEVGISYSCAVPGVAWQSAAPLSTQDLVITVDDVMSPYGCLEVHRYESAPPPDCPRCTGVSYSVTWSLSKCWKALIDPDGLVYDAKAVQAGSSITASIMTNAWVTCTQQMPGGQTVVWSAATYNQVNPQYTDVRYPDHVLRPGYYSFMVPPGNYRIHVTAPGYLSYNSQVLQVVDAPVTLNVPMQRATGQTVSVWHRLCLPFALKK